MTSKPFDQWHDRDLPTLREVVRIFESDPGYPKDFAGLLRFTNGLLDRDELYGALLALKRGEYITVHDGGRLSGPSAEDLIVTDITEKAYRAVGAWPSNEVIADKLLAALQDIAEYSDDPVEKSRAKKAAEALGGFSRDTLIAVIGSAAGVAMQ